MQSIKSAQAMEKINYFRHHLYDYLRKCIDWYVHECPDDVEDEIKETYDSLIELYNLIANVRIRKEWEANPACFYDIVEAYYNEGEASYGTYDGYAK